MRLKFKALMYNCTDVPSDFKYPDEGLLPVQGMLSAVGINNPNGKNLEGEHICHIIKCGFTMGTTIGTLSGFMSHVCKDLAMGNLDSVERVIVPMTTILLCSPGVVILELSLLTPLADFKVLTI
ncbi:hypothetical protein EDB83DRAFT_2514164 [Lactarius deliciosus]|nr:hypothetical protein EDB83DRAFT_2514164 [Lactarius deliciosus]